MEFHGVRPAPLPFMNESDFEKYGRLKYRNTKQRRIHEHDAKRRFKLEKKRKEELKKMRKGRLQADLNVLIHQFEVWNVNGNTESKIYKVGKRKRNEVKFVNEAQAIHEQVFNAMFIDKEHRPAVFQILAKQTAWLANLAVCTTWKQVAASTFQMAVSMSHHIDISTVWQFLTLAGWERETKPTVVNESFTSVAKSLRDLRTKWSTLESSGLHKGVMKIFMLMSITGLMNKPDVKINPTIIDRIFEKWERRVHLEAKDQNIVEVMFDSILFAAEFMDAVISGDTAKLIQPSDIMQEASELIALEDIWRNGLLEIHDMTQHAYKERIERCLSNIAAAVRNEKGPGKMMFARQRVQLLTILNDIKTLKSTIQMRPPAVTICLTGKSQIGKSGIMAAVFTLVGKALGFPTNDDNLYWSNPSDEYDSGYTGNKTVYICDDAAPEKPKYMPSKWISQVIKLTNIQPTHAIKAEVEGKGAIPMMHHLNLLSSNSFDLNYLETLNFPEAAYNRIRFYEVALLPEFDDGYGRVDPSKIPADVHEIHKFRVFEWRRVNSEGLPKYQMVSQEWMTTAEFYLDVVRYSKEKRRSGENYKAQIEGFRTQPVCPTCGIFTNLCKCAVVPAPPVSPSPSVAEEQEDSEDEITFVPDGSVHSEKVNELEYDLAQIDAMVRDREITNAAAKPARAKLIKELQALLDNNQKTYAQAVVGEHELKRRFKNESVFMRKIYTYVYGSLQESVLGFLANFVPMLDYGLTTCVHKCIGAYAARIMLYQSVLPMVILRALATVMHIYGAVVCFMLLPVYCAIRLFLSGTDDFFDLYGYPLSTALVWRSSTLISLWLIYLFAWRMKTLFVETALTDLRNSVSGSPIDQYLRAARIGMTIGMTFTTIYALRSTIKSLFSMANTAQFLDEGNLNPQSVEDVDERRASPNAWPYLNLQIHRTEKVRMASATLKQVQEDIYVKNCARLVQDIQGHVRSTNIFFVKSNILIMPKHAYRTLDKEHPVSIVRNQHFVGGFIPDVYLTRPIEIGLDFVMLQTSKGIFVEDAVQWFAPYRLTGQKQECRMISREKDGTVVHRKFMYNTTTQGQNEEGNAPGSTHVTDTPTKSGDCGSPVFLAGNPFYITGFHCGGSEPTVVCGYTVGTKQASCFSVTRDEITDALAKMSTFHNESYIIGYSGDPIMEVSEPPLSLYDLPGYVYDAVIHARDCMNFIVATSARIVLEPIGSISQVRFKRKSKVSLTVISEFLDQLARPNKWGPPKFASDRNHSETLQAILNGVYEIPPSILSLAIEDYILDVEHMIPKLSVSGVRPLTYMEAINGRPGERYINRIPMNTSAGYLLQGGKEAHFDRETLENGECVDHPKQYITDEYHRTLEKLKQGIPPRHPYVSALKDEPTPVDKTKVRVFQVSSLIMSIIWRQYTLPILDFLFSIPLVSEMAQGVNCEDEWDQLGKFMFDHSHDCLEGDFSKFDASISGQLIRAVGYIFCRIARRIGYTEEDVLVLQTLFVDVSYKAMLWNGSMFYLDRLVPSGVTITVFINGICNMLLHRVAWIILWRENEMGPIENFRKWVHMLTMGDDSVGSTRKPWFNMYTLQMTFARMGMKYTDGRKNEVAVPFFAPPDIRFCKRAWLYNAFVDQFVAPLELDSIYKSLHCQMISATNAIDITVGNVEQALRELALHPREVYDAEADIIRSACIAAGIDNYIQYLSYSYGDWWLKLYPRYHPEPMEAVEVDSPLTVSSPSEDQESSGSDGDSESLD